MKKIQSKSLLALVVLLTVIGVVTTSADRFIGINNVAAQDTIRGGESEEFYEIDNPNRVKYPAILREHRDESKEYISNYVRKERAYIKLMFKRGQNYMPVAREILNKYDVPREFQVLPALESNFSANAVSPAGAVGFWQFMPELAREYGLKMGEGFDERRDFRKSTVAAAKFFRNQLKVYENDILLVVAAYNCGPGRVNLAMKKSGASDYWSIRQFLPAETRAFVMRFLALNVVEMNFEKFLENNLDLEEPAKIQIAKSELSSQDENSTLNEL
ncbi:MAG: lytic transglycosylase domain-containing protein [Chitinophagaceae bacterium]|nr:lytic transglycosylase domain-containing protein [Chitinophagaceae bacterium]